MHAWERGEDTNSDDDDDEDDDDKVVGDTERDDLESEGEKRNSQILL